MLPRAFRRAAALLSVAAAAAASGCDGSATLPEGVAGNYLLVTINGQPLPLTLPGTAPGITSVAKEGRLTLESDAEFSQILVFNTRTSDPNDIDPGDTRSESAGEVEVSGNTIRFRPRFENEYSGTIGNGTLTYTRNAGSVALQFTFQKQP
ncbi:MAG TPA: hypothetical protein VF746_31560 [Longimicrobium sp.]|jgi:hypothetical protein